eukprot:1158581-Pelagomonas_calceolata.AAC.5
MADLCNGLLSGTIIIKCQPTCLILWLELALISIQPACLQMGTRAPVRSPQRYGAATSSKNHMLQKPIVNSVRI